MTGDERAELADGLEEFAAFLRREPLADPPVVPGSGRPVVMIGRHYDDVDEMERVAELLGLDEPWTNTSDGVRYFGYERFFGSLVAYRVQAKARR